MCPTAEDRRRRMLHLIDCLDRQDAAAHRVCDAYVVGDQDRLMDACDDLCHASEAVHNARAAVRLRPRAAW